MSYETDRLNECSCIGSGSDIGKYVLGGLCLAAIGAVGGGVFGVAAEGAVQLFSDEKREYAVQWAKYGAVITPAVAAGGYVLYQTCRGLKRGLEFISGFINRK